MLLVTILIAALLCVQHVAGDDCTIGDNICTATCGETKIDISPIKFPVTISADDGSYTYVVDLCKGTTCDGDSANTPNSTVCLQSNSEKVNCGQASADTMTWTLHSTNPMNFTIIYGGGDCDGGTNCKSSVFTFSYAQPSDLQCGANVNFTGTDNTIYSFSVTANLCDNNFVGIIGLVLIALAIIAVLIYITAGVLFNAFYKGAVGKEIIPNYNFWIDLPFLIKDGFLFVFYTPCQACRKTSDYEKI